jgi:hypothetical protein
MAFEEFNHLVLPILGEKAMQIRTKYISVFINTDTERYRNSIARKISFKDGFYYKGYLWDCLKSKELITEREIFEKLQQSNREMYVFWDLHSSEKITIENYWKYPRDAILSLRGEVLLSGLTFLPDDIYIFDTSFLWSLILTHEDIEGERYCLEAYPA